MLKLSDMIPLRKSVRSYTDARVDEATLAKIGAFIDQAKPLIPGIRIKWEFVERNRVRCILPWIPQQSIAIYTEDVSGAPENVGFIFQQLDLYLSSIGLGACWLGMGRVKNAPKSDDLHLVMMMAFGHPKGDHQRRSLSEFKRKRLNEISDTDDPRLESARLAPSSVNSQPWRFTHDGDIIHAHCTRSALSAAPGEMNRTDMGIALAHMYVSHPDSFEFFRAENVAPPRGCSYIGSFRL